MQAKYVSSAIVLMLLCSCIFAQERKLTLSIERRTDNSVDFKYTKTDPGTYTIQMTFTDLVNGSVHPALYTTFGYSGKLLTINPIDKSKAVNFSYRYNYIRGKLNPRIDRGFIYLLPYPEGTEVQIMATTFLRSMYFGEEEPEDWNSYRYYTHEKSTVTAMRKGIVVDIIDEHDAPDMDGVSYTSSLNSIMIEHEDGTLAYYAGFEKGSIAVKSGETVFPGTALGQNIRIDRNRGYYVSVIIQYLNNIVQDAETKLIARSGRFYGFVTPHFTTAEGEGIILEHAREYRATAPAAIVTKEMSRREKKQWETGK